MKKFLVTIAVIIVTSLIIQPYTAWWVVAPIGFIAGFMFRLNALAAFAAGFLGIFILWAVYAFMLSSANNHILAGKVAELFKVSSAGVLYVVSGIIGGLVAGFGTMTGTLAAKMRE